MVSFRKLILVGGTCIAAENVSSFIQGKPKRNKGGKKASTKSPDKKSSETSSSANDVDNDKKSKVSTGASTPTQRKSPP